MTVKSTLRWLALQFLIVAVVTSARAAEQAMLDPGSTFTVGFPNMPPTFYAVSQKQDVMAQMTITVHLPPVAETLIATPASRRRLAA